MVRLHRVSIRTTPFTRLALLSRGSIRLRTTVCRRALKGQRHGFIVERKPWTSLQAAAVIVASFGGGVAGAALTSGDCCGVLTCNEQLSAPPFSVHLA